MEFNQIENFLSVVKYKSFSKAAEKLYLTQPTVSNNIQKLEKELNTTLLDRKSKTITLTETGKTFYTYAVEIINMRDQAKFCMNKFPHKIEGEIELDASSIPERYVLPYIIRDFTALYPRVSFTINQKNSQQIVDDIMDGKQSFGIVGAKYESLKLEYIDFYEDELVLAVPYDDKFNMRPQQSLHMDTLFSEKFIFRRKGSGTRHLIEQRLLDKGINIKDLHIVFYADSNEMIKKMVELKLGVSFISNISIKNECDLKLIKSYHIDDLDLKRNFYFVFSKNRTLPPLVEVFKDFLIHWKGITF